MMLIVLLTAPNVAVAPTGNPSDAIAIQNARNLQGQWVMYSVMVGGFATGALGKTMLKELGRQYAIQVAGNTAVEGWKSWKEDKKFDFVNNVLLQSLKNLDFFDAYLGTLQMTKIAKVALSASIDISPEEAEVLGLNKDIKSVTVDAIFGIISEASQNEIAKARYGKILKSLMSRADEAMQSEINKEIKKQLGDEAYNNFTKELEKERKKNMVIQDKTTQPNDNTTVVMPPVPKCNECP